VVGKYIKVKNNYNRLREKQAQEAQKEGTKKGRRCGGEGPKP
jgi:hypothetical protein